MAFAALGTRSGFLPIGTTGPGARNAQPSRKPEKHVLIALLNDATGVGRTTIAAHLAGWLAQRDVRVAAIDTDPHGALTRWLRCAAPQVPVRGFTTANQLHALARRLAGEHDVVVADGPSGRKLETATLAAVCDLCVLPIGPTQQDAWAAAHTARVVNLVRRHPKRCGFPLAFAVANRVGADDDMAAIQHNAARRLRLPVTRCAVHAQPVIAEARGRGRLAGQLGPRGEQAAHEFSALFESMLEVSSGEQRALSADACVADWAK
ncbi:MAG: hypothetical protein D6744_06960 [Planctomycetota bacterium]|nr:MAG: hypothetical protein D6744_06960 [Planctomycetota bacterium]